MNYRPPIAVQGLTLHRADSQRSYWWALGAVAVIGMLAAVSISLLGSAAGDDAIDNRLSSFIIVDLSPIQIESPPPGTGGLQPTEGAANHASRIVSTDSASGCSTLSRPSPKAVGFPSFKSGMMSTDAWLSLPRIAVRGDLLLPGSALTTGNLILYRDGRVKFVWDDSLHGMEPQMAQYIAERIRLAYAQVRCTPATKNGVFITTTHRCRYTPQKGQLATVVEKTWPVEFETVERGERR